MTDFLWSEFHVAESKGLVRTRVPHHEITAQMIAEAAQAMQLNAGDHLVVQSMGPDYQSLLHEAEFVVVSARVTVVPDGERNVRETEYEIAVWTPWRAPSPI